MSDYDVATRRLLLQVAKERIAAQIEQANEEMAHIPAGTRIAGRAGTLRLGAVTIPESQPSVSVTGPYAFTAWVAKEWPREMKDAVRPEYFSDPRLIALVKEHLPEMTERVVSPVFRNDVTESVLAHGGWHDENGEVRPVPGVERNPGGGARTPTANLHKAVKAVAKNPDEPLPAAMVAKFGEIGLGPLALPAGGESDG